MNKHIMLSIFIILLIASCTTDYKMGDKLVGESPVVTDSVETDSSNIVQGTPLYDLYIAKDENGESEKEDAIEKSSSNNSQNFMSLRKPLGALNAVISVRPTPLLINEQIRLIDNLIETAEVSKNIDNNQSPYQDKYLAWVSRDDGSHYMEEEPLYESYSFFYISQFLYYLQQNGWVNRSSEHQKWWENTLAFVERNIWEKWFVRSYNVSHDSYEYFLRKRIHMGSHWAGMALYLKRMTSDPEKKAQYVSLLEQYNLLLRRNLKPNPDEPSAYIWNATYDNVSGTDAENDGSAYVQDVSHGNHVVSYIVAAYEVGEGSWSMSDIQKLCNTVKYVLYNDKTNTFNDLLDGTRNPSRPGWGNFVADGWVKLGNYDKEVKQIFEEFGKNEEILTHYNQDLAYKANLIKIRFEEIY